MKKIYAFSLLTSAILTGCGGPDSPKAPEVDNAGGAQQATVTHEVSPVAQQATATHEVSPMAQKPNVGYAKAPTLVAQSTPEKAKFPVPEKVLINQKTPPLDKDLLAIKNTGTDQVPSNNAQVATLCTVDLTEIKKANGLVTTEYRLHRHKANESIHRDYNVHMDAIADLDVTACDQLYDAFAVEYQFYNFREMKLSADRVNGKFVSTSVMPRFDQSPSATAKFTAKFNEKNTAMIINFSDQMSKQDKEIDVPIFSSPDEYQNYGKDVGVELRDWALNMAGHTISPKIMNDVASDATGIREMTERTIAEADAKKILVPNF